MAAVIDSHHHFWQLASGRYGWISPQQPKLCRDYAPDDLAPELARAGVDGTILVAAGDGRDELAAMQVAAARAGFMRGIVGPLTIDAQAAEYITECVAVPLLVGFRPHFDVLLDDDSRLNQQARLALDAMAGTGLVLDCLVASTTMQGVGVIAHQFPDLAIVVDHAANPDLAGDEPPAIVA